MLAAESRRGAPPQEAQQLALLGRQMVWQDPLVAAQRPGRLIVGDRAQLAEAMLAAESRRGAPPQEAQQLALLLGHRILPREPPQPPARINLEEGCGV